jgi:hypothetical protein
MADVSYNYARVSISPSATPICKTESTGDNDCVLLDIELEWSWDVPDQPLGSFKLYRYEDGGAGGIGSATFVATIPESTSGGGTETYTDQIALPDTSRGFVSRGFGNYSCADYDPPYNSISDVYCNIEGQVGYYVQYTEGGGGPTGASEQFTGPGEYPTASLTLPCCVAFHHIAEFEPACNLLSPSIENCNYQALVVRFGNPLETNPVAAFTPSLEDLFASQLYLNDVSNICSLDGWTLYRKTPNGVLEEIATGGIGTDPDIFYEHTDRFFDSSSNDLCSVTIPAPEGGDPITIVKEDDIDCGVPFAFPDTSNNPVRYFVKWEITGLTTATEVCSGPGDSPQTLFSDPEDYEILALSGIFSSGVDLYVDGLPCCTDKLTITDSEVGDCFSEQQGDVQISWSLNYEDNEVPVSIEIDRPATASFSSLNVELPPGYADFETGWVDSGLVLPVDCTSSEIVTYNITFTYQDATGATLTEVQSVDVEIPCCFDECVGDGDGDGDCDLCWKVDGTDLQLYLESYFEDPFARQASFQIKYCIDDRCSLGISDATVYITLPIFLFFI